MSSAVIPFSSAITELGFGYDSTNGQVKGSPFRGDVAEEDVQFHSNSLDEDGPDQMTVQYKMRLIESHSDLRETLDISGKFSGKRGNISGSLSGGFLDQDINTKNNVYLLITVEVVHSIIAIAGNPDIDPVQVPGHPLAGVDVTQSSFFDTYGDSYIAAIERGGRLDGLVEISAEDSSNLFKIKAEAKVEIEGLASGQVSLDYVVGKLTKDRQTRVTVNAVGGGIGFSPMDARSFVHLAKTFPIMVNGGVGQTVEFRVKVTVTEEDGKEKLIEEQQKFVRDIEFPGIAVPVRAVIRPYKSLPIFSYSPSEVTRLSNYITEDLIEYYQGHENAKGKITDLIENSTGELNVTDLVGLDGVRADVRLEQSKLLSVIDTATKSNDVTAAEEAEDALAELTPGQIYLLQANVIAKGAIRRLELLELQRLAKERKAEDLKEEAKQRLKEYNSNVIQLSDNVKIFDGDRVVIVTSDGRALSSGKGENKYMWKRDLGEESLWAILKVMTVEEARENVNDWHEKVAGLIRNRYIELLQEKLDFGEITMDEYLSGLENISANEPDADENMVDWAMSSTEIWNEEMMKVGEEGRDMVVPRPVLEGKLADGESFFVETVDATRKVVRIRNEVDLYWRHRLQWLRYGVVTLEALENQNDESFMFRLESTDSVIVDEQALPAVYIEPENGTVNWKLFSFEIKSRRNLKDVFAGAPAAEEVVNLAQPMSTAQVFGVFVKD